MAQAKPTLDTVWGSTGATTNPGATKMNLGWTSEIPTHQVQNFWQQRSDEMLTHLNEQGIAEWDAVTVYPLHAWAKGSDGRVYRAIDDSEGEDPISSPTEWTRNLGGEPIVVGRDSNANGSYKIWSNGDIEQWGVDLTPDYAGKTLTLPIAFALEVSEISFQQLDSSVTHQYPIVATALTTTTVSYKSANSNTATDKVYWSVIGI